MPVYVKQTKGSSELLPFAFIFGNEGFGEKDCLPQNPTTFVFPSRDILVCPV